MASLALAFDILARDQASPTLKRVGDEVERTGKKVDNFGGSVGRGMGTAAKAVSSFGAVAGVIAGGALVAGLRSVISASSDAEQSVGGVQAVFKDYARSVISDSKSADRALGLSANSYRELATVIGSQLKNAGIPLRQLSDQTETVIQTGADLAAQFGGSTQEAVEALSAAFRGETDPIERYGISLTAAAVGAKAVQLGLSNSETDLSQNAKLMATLAIITEQGADAQGAFGREADTAAGRAQRASAQWDNLKVTIGDELLPAWSALVDILGTSVIPLLGDVVSVGGKVLGFIADLPAPLQLAAVAAGAWAIAGGKILNFLRPLGGLLTPLRGTVSAFGEAMAYARQNGDGLGTVLRSVGQYAGGQALSGLKALGRAIGPELGIAVAVVTVSSLVEEFQRLTTASSEAKAAASGLADGLTLIDRAADRSAVRQAIEDTDGLVEALGRAGVASDVAIQGLLGNADAQDHVTEALQRYLTAHRSGQFQSDDDKIVRQAIEDYLELATGYDNAAGAARFFGDESDGATSGAAASGEAAAATVPQFDEATAAIERWKQQLQSVNEAFVDPLASYKELLQEKQDAERASAEATAAATDSSKDSWEDYVQSVGVSLDEYADRLQGQIDAQENWRTNLVAIAQRGGADVAQILADMGQDGVTLTAQMADGTDAEFRRMADLLRRDARLGGQGATDELDKAMTVMAEVGRQGAAATAQGVAQQLGLGVAEVRRIAAQYGVELAAGINPILQGLGKAHIAFTTRAGFNAGGGLWAGGYTGDGGKYTPMGIVHGGEFVFTKEQTAKAGKSTLAVWAKILDGYAGGGFVSTGQVPRPRSTDPYRFPVDYPADATMDREYRETVSWVAAQAAARAAAAAASLIGAVPGAPSAAGGNVGLGQALAAARGWVGAQWNALYTLWMHESGWNNNAQNPTSTAYGIPQFLNSTWASTGYAKTSDPRTQILAGLNYIGSRYGSPAGAWGFWQQHHWYDNGGWLPPGVSIAHNNTGRPERVMGPSDGQNFTVIAQFGSETVRAQAVRVVRDDRYRQGVNARSS